MAAPPTACYLTRDSLLSEARRAARSGSRDLARELLEQRLSTWPDDDELRAELARVDAWDGRWAASEAGYRRVLARHPDDPEVRAGLVPGGRGAWRDHYRSFDPLHVAAYCATEHQLDAYFLLDALAGSDPTGRYRAAADQLGARIVDALWLPSEGRFAVAVTERGAVTDRALDAAGAWGALFLLARGDRARAERSLDYTLRTFTRRGSGLRGYAPYAGTAPDHPGQDFSETLFAEGTAGVAMALLRVGRTREAEELSDSLRALQRQGDGGVVYAVPASEDFPDLAAAAPTAWLLFLEIERRDRRPVVFGG